MKINPLEKSQLLFKHLAYILDMGLAITIIVLTPYLLKIRFILDFFSEGVYLIILTLALALVVATTMGFYIFVHIKQSLLVSETKKFIKLRYNTLEDFPCVQITIKGHIEKVSQFILGILNDLPIKNIKKTDEGFQAINKMPVGVLGSLSPAMWFLRQLEAQKINIKLNSSNGKVNLELGINSNIKSFDYFLLNEIISKLTKEYKDLSVSEIKTNIKSKNKSKKIKQLIGILFLFLFVLGLGLDYHYERSRANQVTESFQLNHSLGNISKQQIYELFEFKNTRLVTPYVAVYNKVYWCIQEIGYGVIPKKCYYFDIMDRNIIEISYETFNEVLNYRKEDLILNEKSNIQDIRESSNNGYYVRAIDESGDWQKIKIYTKNDELVLSLYRTKSKILNLVVTSNNRVYWVERNEDLDKAYVYILN